VQHGQPVNPSEPPSSANHGHSTAYRVRAWASPVATFGLVGVTSYAVAVYASAWLVLPYLGLMAFVLGMPGDPGARLAAGRRGLRALRSRVESQRARRSAARAMVGDGPVVVVDLNVATDGAPEAEENEVPSADAAAAKGKRGKGGGRVRRPRPAPAEVEAAAVEPAAATWVRIGPGKFVRADVSAAIPFGIPTITPRSAEAEVTIHADLEPRTSPPAEPPAPCSVPKGDGELAQAQTEAPPPQAEIAISHESPGSAEDMPAISGQAEPAEMAPQDIGTSGSVFWTTPMSTAPAVEPEASDAEDHSLRRGCGVGDGLVPGIVFDPVPGASDVWTAGSHGIAPDTPAAHASSGSQYAEGAARPIESEPSPVPDVGSVARAREPAGDGCTSASVEAVVPLSELELEPEPASLHATWRGLRALAAADGRAWGRSRVGARPRSAIRAGSSRGGKRGWRAGSSREAGTRRSACRLRSVRRFPGVDRAHPPRSPPIAW
jgi:hypothetical protein